MVMYLLPDRSVADQREGARDTPQGLNSFNFMQFWGKFGKIICRSPGELTPPPLGNPGSATVGNISGNHIIFGFCFNSLNLLNLVEIHLGQTLLGLRPYLYGWQWQIQDFSEEEAPNLRGAPTYDFAKFSHMVDAPYLGEILDLPTAGDCCY